MYAERLEQEARAAREEASWQQAYDERQRRKQARWEQDWDQIAAKEEAELRRIADDRRAARSERAFQNPENRRKKLDEFRDMSFKVDRILRTGPGYYAEMVGRCKLLGG